MGQVGGHRERRLGSGGWVAGGVWGRQRSSVAGGLRHFIAVRGQAGCGRAGVRAGQPGQGGVAGGCWGAVGGGC